TSSVDGIASGLFGRMLFPRETMGTLLLGTASAALAIVMLIVTLGGLSGFPIAPWTVPRQVMVAANPASFTTGPPGLVSSGRICVPSPHCLRMAWLGLI